jgi:hypothetical protein
MENKKRGSAELAFIYCLAVSVGAVIVALQTGDIVKKCNTNYCKVFGHEYRDTQTGRFCWICDKSEKEVENENN